MTTDYLIRSVKAADGMQSGMLADQAADPKIAFSLSERSFALFPPLEHHDGSFPPLAPPSVEPTPSFNDVDDAYPVKAEAGMLGVRGDSFVNGLSQLGTSPELTMSNLMVAAALSYPAPPHKHGPIVMVCSYTEFDDLAHGPRGTEATRAVRTYRLDLTDGSLTLLSALPQGDVHNPAFCRRHPRLNIVYACTESVKQDGQVIALHLDGKTGAMREHCPPVSACGTSTCYLTIHKVRAATPEREPLAQPLSRADRRTPLSARTPGITHTPSRTLGHVAPAPPRLELTSCRPTATDSAVRRRHGACCSSTIGTRRSAPSSCCPTASSAATWPRTTPRAARR